MSTQEELKNRMMMELALRPLSEGTKPVVQVIAEICADVAVEYYSTHSVEVITSDGETIHVIGTPEEVSSVQAATKVGAVVQGLLKSMEPVYLSGNYSAAFELQWHVLQHILEESKQ